MSVNKVVSLLSLLVALAGICISENIRSEVVLVDSVETGEAQVDVTADFSGETFHATNEWQEVKPGQVLPSGLHYRYEYSIITSTINCMHKYKPLFTPTLFPLSGSTWRRERKRRSFWMKCIRRNRMNQSV